MSDGRRSAVLVALATLLAGLLAAPIAPAAGAAPLQPDEVDPDDVLLSAAVEESGDATWTVTYRVQLATDEEERAFESVRSDVESEPATYRERFRNRLNATAEDASATTGREMAIRNVSVSAEREELPQAYGVVTYRFRWTNFTATDGDALEAGDAVGGLPLDNETTLLVAGPDGYAVESATPAPAETRENAVVWEGPRRFTADEPRARFAPAAETTDDGGLPVEAMPLVAVALLVAAGAAAAVAARRGAGPFGDDGSGPDPGPAPTDGELLSNEEQVIRLLEEHGGRMKQAAVAEALGWTDAKTSQVTTDLREAGQLEAFRLGRENVLTLPDDD